MVAFETQLLIAGIAWDDLQKMSDNEIVSRVAAVQIVEEHQQDLMAAQMAG